MSWYGQESQENAEKNGFRDRVAIQVQQIGVVKHLAQKAQAGVTAYAMGVRRPTFKKFTGHMLLQMDASKRRLLCLVDTSNNS